MLSHSLSTNCFYIVYTLFIKLSSDQASQTCSPNRNYLRHDEVCPARDTNLDNSLYSISSRYSQTHKCVMGDGYRLETILLK